MFNIFRGRPSQQSPILSLDDVKANLQKLCQPPAAGTRSQKSEKQVREIRFFLQVLDERRNRPEEQCWATRPRLYAILHSLKAEYYMDQFISENFTDFNLPFNEQTLPSFLGNNEGRDLRHDFFAIQDYYLTDARDIESEKPFHVLLSVTGDMHFNSIGVLGSGGFGAVDRVISRLSTEQFARKRVLRSRGSEQSQLYIVNELKELRRLSHQHLVRIVGSYTDIDYIAYLMKPVAQMTLEEFLSEPNNLRREPRAILRRFYGCLAGAMNYLYSNKVRHRDLTARNILVDSVGEVYISDFGSAYNWTSKPSSKTKHRDVPTSADYMAPEMAKGDDRGTRSDMWSLGVVYLEMTTKLLNHRVVELKERLRINADKTKTRPYPYANPTVVRNWIETLGKASTNYNHDREPLEWVRELLHVEQHHRPTPPQLMKFILESPSFEHFCCLKCAHDFESEAFTHGPISSRTDGSRTDAQQDSRETRDAIEDLFDTSWNSSIGRTDSIKRWIDDPSQFNDGEWDDDTLPYDPIDPQQLLYSTCESQFYSSTHTAHTLIHPSSRSSSSPPPSLTEPNELLGDLDRPQEILDSPELRRTPQKGEKAFRDSGMGFLEYVSDSSDDGKPKQPFEEISDRSSVESEEEMLGDVLSGPLGSFFEQEIPLDRTEQEDVGRRESSELHFDEEEDCSEAGNPWDEASDRSESEDSSRVDGKDIIKSKMPSQDESKRMVVRNTVRNSSIEKRRDSDSGLWLLSAPTKKRTSIDAKRDDIEENWPGENQSGRDAAVPEIVIHPAAGDQQDGLKLSEKNVKSIPGQRRSRIVPRTRDALVPLDVLDLMNNTWEMASSAPTSTISEEASFKISRLLLMMPTEAQIESALTEYCKKGSAGAVKSVLRSTVSRTKPLKYRQFFKPLLRAVQGATARHNKCVRVLLAVGVDPNHKSRSTGLTPLHIAVEHANFEGYTNLIWLLLANGANPNAKDSRGELPLTRLFVGGGTEPLEPHKRIALIMLIREGAKLNFTMPGTGNTPLHLAVRRQDATVVAILLFKGAVVNAKNTSGTTPLQMTANQFRGELVRRHAEVLSHLLQSGARVDEPAGALNRTPLHWAVIAGCAQAVAMLLEAKADARLPDQDGYDAVALALRNVDKLTVDADERKLQDHVEIMQKLDEAARCEWNLDGTCAIEAACGSNSEESKNGKFLENLLKRGLDPKVRFRQGTILEFARQKGSPAVQNLLEEWEEPAKAIPDKR
ncbi:hypothetical protein CDD82_5486 [Ophiocordyceps australis]|uniref:EKC/KEOPS complex subunit BUD32 n=1 Tax=Ophiocordyceps australis TaxID=1399860 RepID=A0A2C5Z192_9HYPO|nr:hypothetical protein CDD82_5486 [Ophiocordyceps australis]